MLDADDTHMTFDAGAHAARADDLSAKGGSGDAPAAGGQPGDRVAAGAGTHLPPRPGGTQGDLAVSRRP